MEPEATHEMIVCQAGNLHKRVDDSRPHAPETSSDEVFAYQIGLGGLDRYLAGIAKAADYGLVIHKAPDILVE